MLRITTTGTPPQPVRLSVEGTLDRRTVGALAKACMAALDDGPQSPVTVDLSAVRFVDGRGVSVVRALARRNVQFVGCSPLVSRLIQEMAP